MEEDYADLPSEHLMALESGSPASPPVQETDFLDYYLGPTGVPDKLRSANEFFNPLVGVYDAMSYAGQAGNSDLSPEERMRYARMAAMETAIAAVPIPVARAVRSVKNAMPMGYSTADDATALVETFTGATPDLEDPSRRKFLAGIGAVSAVPILPNEQLISAIARGSSGALSGTALGALNRIKSFRNQIGPDVARSEEISRSIFDLQQEQAMLQRRWEEIPGTFQLSEPRRADLNRVSELQQEIDDLRRRQFEVDSRIRKAEAEYKNTSADRASYEVQDMPDPNAQEITDLLTQNDPAEVLADMNPEEAAAVLDVAMDNLMTPRGALSEGDPTADFFFEFTVSDPTDGRRATLNVERFREVYGEPTRQNIFDAAMNYGSDEGVSRLLSDVLSGRFVGYKPPL